MEASQTGHEPPSVQETIGLLDPGGHRQSVPSTQVFNDGGEQRVIPRVATRRRTVCDRTRSPIDRNAVEHPDKIEGESQSRRVVPRRESSTEAAFGDVTRTHVVTVDYHFTTPAGREIADRDEHDRPELRRTELPTPGTAVRVLYLDESTYALL